MDNSKHSKDYKELGFNSIEELNSYYELCYGFDKKEELNKEECQAVFRIMGFDEDIVTKEKDKILEYGYNKSSERVKYIIKVMAEELLNASMEDKSVDITTLKNLSDLLHLVTNQYLDIKNRYEEISNKKINKKEVYQ